MQYGKSRPFRPLAQAIGLALAFGAVAPRQAAAIQVLSLSQINGDNGFYIDGESDRQFLGFPLAAIGDINGDGLDDIAVGAYFKDAGSGFVVFGRNGANPFPTSLSISQLDGTNGFRINGSDARDRTTYSMQAAGDINGDGHADLIFGVPKADPNGVVDAGSAYAVFGRTADQSFPAILNVADIRDDVGFRINGALAGDTLDYGVTSVGDFNGDAIDDFAVAATRADPQAPAGCPFRQRLTFRRSTELPVSIWSAMHQKVASGMPLMARGISMATASMT